jgi:hypothetical protein
MSAPVHFAVTNDWGLYADRNACCGNNFHRRKKLTDDPAKVDCPECRALCGFEAEQTILGHTADEWTVEVKELPNGRFQVAA